MIQQSTSQQTTDYTYDASGHITQEINGNTTTHYIYNKQGRVTKITQTDSTNAVNEMTVATYTYDPFNRRISKTTGQGAEQQTIYFLYDAKGLLAEYTEQGQLIRQYDYYQDSWSTDPIYQYSQATNPDGTTAQSYTYSFYHNDHLGTPQLLMENNGAVSWRAAYEAFGEATQLALAQGAVTKENLLRFPGQYYDKEMQTHYNFHRDYNPALGRYLTSDPIGLGGGINMYVYASSDSLMYVDPLGLSTVAIGAEVGGSVGGPIGAGVGGLLGLGALILLQDGGGRGTGTADPNSPTFEMDADSDYSIYKGRCGTAPRKTGDYCEDLKRRIKWFEDCIKLRQEWDDKYWPGKHEGKIKDDTRVLRELRRKLNKSWLCNKDDDIC